MTLLKHTVLVFQTNGTSNGLVPMLRVYNNTARYVDQGGNKVRTEIYFKLSKMSNNACSIDIFGSKFNHLTLCVCLFRDPGPSLCIWSRGISMCLTSWSWRKTRVKRSRGPETCSSHCGSQTSLWNEWKAIRWILEEIFSLFQLPHMLLFEHSNILYNLLYTIYLLSLSCSCRTGPWCVPVNVLG